MDHAFQEIQVLGPYRIRGQPADGGPVEQEEKTGAAQHGEEDDAGSSHEKISTE
jgi:hypothetical protein